MLEHRAKILIVDDDLGALDALVDILTFEGHEVLSAVNGVDALACLKNAYPPEVIVLDLVMPIMDGYEFLKVRRSDPYLSKIPVIVATGERNPGVGADAILQKPIDADVLIREISRLTTPPEKSTPKQPRRRRGAL